MAEFDGIDLSSPKVLLFGGGVIGIALVLLMNRESNPSTPAAQTVTLQPPDGVSWNDIMPAPSGGVIGTVGPGEPVPGDSAYQEWLQAGHTGTMQDFLDSLKGAKGDTGATGPQGKPGTPGKTVVSPPPPPVHTTTPENPWIRVKYNGQTGYAHKSYMCGNKVCNTGGDGLRLRKSASYTGTVLSVMPEGATFQRLGAGEAFTHNPTPFSGVSAFYPNPVPLGVGQSITVEKGDSYTSLARRAYGYGDFANRIKRLNSDNLPLTVGQKLRI